MIELETDAGQTVITICKYDDYQDAKRVIDAAIDAAATQDRRSSDANKKEGKPLKPLNDDVNGAGYAFAGKIIRLNQADFNRWEEAYQSIPDLKAELTALDDYFHTQNPKNWFAAVSGALKKRNNQYLDGKKQPAHKMTDAEYNRLHSDLVTSNPMGGAQ
ncbi:hypothetical protein [Sneathiella sp.]|uniref:hypothetical protein n=1 Tax=Sneathiella sp. TaxID=1964365 RepID=UPI0025F1278D|nr:hypothetical protein [Sneathiella sp.]